MKSSPRRHAVSDELVIPLPEPRLLRLIARSFLLFSLLLSLPWLRSSLLSDSTPDSAVDELFYLPKLLQDMKAYGLIDPHGGRSLFLGNPGIHSSLLKRNGVSCLPERKIPNMLQDFVFLVAVGFKDDYFRSMDASIKVGGVAAFRLGTHPVKPFNLPANYRVIYIQNIGRTIVAVKKLYHDKPGRRLRRRRLLSEALEDALLEPPVTKKQRKKVRYLMGGSLDGYSRRVFVDIGLPGRIGAEAWFRKKYPRNKGFEIVRVDLVDLPAASAGDVGEWMRDNVREEEYVVVKAEAEAVEEMRKGEVMELVDELFLECRKRAYWECLALFGKLRGSGVAVHQWWG